MARIHRGTIQKRSSRGKELDLAKWLGEYWKGVGGPWPELKNGGGIIKSPTVKTTLYNDHVTLLFAEGCYS